MDDNPDITIDEIATSIGITRDGVLQLGFLR